VLNYLINRQLGIKKGGIIAIFVDFRTAFDSVDRKVLLEAEGKGNKKGADKESRRNVKRNKKGKGGRRSGGKFLV